MKSVLSIAGSDSSGGAGIQADIKTIASCGLYAQTVITSLTAQNTTGVFGVYDIDPDFVSRQIDAVFSDIRPDAVKIGMVSSPAIVKALADALIPYHPAHVVLDPVMVSTSGSPLISAGTLDALITYLFPLAEVITPNVYEAERLGAHTFHDESDKEHTAAVLASRFGCAVYVTGGHSIAQSAPADSSDDLLALPDGLLKWFEGRRINTSNTHGTGCSLSSSIACGLAQGLSITDALSFAKSYVAGALAAGLDLGKGSGPIDHMWQYR